MPDENQTDDSQRGVPSFQDSSTSRRRLLRLLGAGGAAGLAGCSADQDGGAEIDDDANTGNGTGSEKELQKNATIGVRSNMINSDWSVDYNYVLGYYGRVLEPLVWVNQKIEPVPWLAKDWERTGDKTWKFTLRDNITFHNGDPLTADLVISAFNKRLDTHDWASDHHNMVPGKLKKVDDMTIEMTTVFSTGNQPGVLSHLATAVFHPEHSVYSDDNSLSDVVGTGPFKVEKVKLDQHAKLSAFDDYWGGNPRSSGPHVEELTMRPITDNNTRALALLGHEIDVGQELPVSQFETIKNAKDTKTTTVTDAGTAYCITNLVDKPTSDVRFRKALNYVVSQEELVEATQNGLGVPARGVVPPMDWASAHDSLSTFGPDKDKAKELVEQSSYNGETIQFVAREGEPPSVGLVGQKIQATAKDIGVNVEVEKMGRSEWYDRRIAGDGHLFPETKMQTSAQTTAMLRRWASPEALPRAPETNPTKNIGKTQPAVQEKYDSLLMKANQKNKGKEKKDLLLEAQHLLIEEATATLPLFHSELLYGFRSNIEGVDWHPSTRMSRVENLKYFK